MSVRCRLRLHKWVAPVEVRDDSIASASGGIKIIAAYRYKYTCARCGLDSDQFYDLTATPRPNEPESSRG